MVCLTADSAALLMLGLVLGKLADLSGGRRLCRGLAEAMTDAGTRARPSDGGKCTGVRASGALKPAGDGVCSPELTELGPGLQ